MFPRMQKAIAHLQPLIRQHPFNIELGRGSLPKAKFEFYLSQDRLYLRDYGQALSVVSQRLSGSPHAQTFQRFNEKTIQYEQKVLAEYLKRLPHYHFFYASPQALEKIPSVQAYTQHILHHAVHSPLPVAVSALIPCFSIFNGLGELMKELSGFRADHPYLLWIQTYSKKSFTDDTREIISIAEDLTENDNPLSQEQMIQAYLESTQHELQFWDSAYHAPRETIESKVSMRCVCG